MFKNIIKNISYYSRILDNNDVIIPCKYCIFYIKNTNIKSIIDDKGKCGKYLDIKKDPLCETIAKKKYCDNNPKYFIY